MNETKTSKIDQNKSMITKQIQDAIRASSEGRKGEKEKEIKRMERQQT